MRRIFSHRTIGNRIYILKRRIGLFGSMLDSIAVFDANGDNIERVKQIVRQLNECDERTYHQEP